MCCFIYFVKEVLKDCNLYVYLDVVLEFYINFGKYWYISYKKFWGLFEGFFK